MRIQSKKAAGITEILISTTIILIVGALMLASADNAKKYIIRARNLTQATEYSASILEELDAVGYDDLDASNLNLPPAALPNCDLKDRYNGTRIYSFVLRLWDGTVVASDEDYKEIQATTAWDKGSITLKTIRRKP